MRSGNDEERELARPSATSLDPVELRERLECWLRTVLPAEAEPRVTSVQVPDANGMSSQTVLFDARWGANGVARERELVARLAPLDNAMPVFPSYGMDLQFNTLRTVRAESRVPVPDTYWLEPDPGPLGAPFFVMRRMSGQVPPDVMPYNFGSWVTEATDEQRTRLQESSIAVLADLHQISDPVRHFGFLNRQGRASHSGESPLRAHVTEQKAYYDWVVASGPDAPIIRRGFEWLAEHWPDDEGEPVFNWGDARIGNIMYRDFRPVAVLDWEMAGLAPREVDLGWFVYLHRFFEDLAEAAGIPGLPDFLRRDDVARTYRDMTGHEPRNLDFYTLYAALRYAIVFLRIQHRALHFGAATMPADPNDLIMHRPALEAMLAGSYWKERT